LLAFRDLERECDEPDLEDPELESEDEEEEE